MRQESELLKRKIMSRREHPEYFEGFKEGLKEGRREPNGQPKSLKENTRYRMLSDTTTRDLGRHLALLAELDSKGKMLESGCIYEIDIEDYEDIPSRLSIVIARKIYPGNEERIVLKKHPLDNY